MQKNIGDNIKKIRKQKGISQKELAKALNISQAAVSQFEKGSTSLRLGTIQKIAAALGVPYLYLIDIHDENDGSFFGWGPEFSDESETIANDLDDLITKNFTEKGIDDAIDLLSKTKLYFNVSIYNTDSIRIHFEDNSVLQIPNADLKSIYEDSLDYFKYKLLEYKRNSHSNE